MSQAKNRARFFLQISFTCRQAFTTQQSMHMNQSTWIILNFLLSAVVTGAWWFAAVRLRSHWILFAMASCSTIGLLLSAVWTWSVVYHPLSGLPSETIVWIRGVQFAFGTAQTACFVLFVAWLVGRSPNPRIA